MASYWPQAVLATYRAGADLTGAQYTVVKFNTAGDVVPVAAVTDVGIGVLQNAPASGVAAEVLVIGGTKIVASAAIALPAVLGVDTSGRAKKIAPGTDTTQYVIGQAGVAAAATGDIIDAIVNFATPARAA